MIVTAGISDLSVATSRSRSGAQAAESRARGCRNVPAGPDVERGGLDGIEAPGLGRRSPRVVRTRLSCRDLDRMRLDEVPYRMDASPKKSRALGPVPSELRSRS